MMDRQRRKVSSDRLDGDRTCFLRTAGRAECLIIRRLHFPIVVEDEANDRVDTDRVFRFTFEHLIVSGGEVVHVAGIGALGTGGRTRGEQSFVVLLQLGFVCHANRVAWGRGSAICYKVVRTTEY